MILDGFGIAPHSSDNAISVAKTPNYDSIMKKYPNVLGAASGLDVGLPDGQMGNSEVGHTNIGAGRVIYQELTRITKEIQDGDFARNPILMTAIENTKIFNGKLHLFGLLSDGGVHSHNTHLYALLEMAKKRGLTNVFVHVFLDGRDTPPQSGLGYVNELEQKMKEIGVGKIATVSGRFYSMDRDNRWERTQAAYDAITLGQGKTAASAKECIEKSYAGGVNDEFVVPTVITENGKPIAVTDEGDSVIYYNFRPDRARQLSKAFCDPFFEEFKKTKGHLGLYYACFTEYDKSIPNKYVVFKVTGIENDLGMHLSKLGKTQLRLAETEKYAHVTFFFNGGNEQPYKGEDRILVPSPKVKTYDLQPEMSAFQVTDKLIEAIESKKYDLIVINYANCDMVGHTGVMSAAVKAVETVDGCIGKVLSAIENNNATMFLCADHGNAEKMLDETTKGPFTAHTTNPVPFVLINCADKKLRENGRLADIAPTLLELLNLPVPNEMTGKSLLI